MAGGDSESGRNGGGKSRKMGEIETALPSMTLAEEGHRGEALRKSDRVSVTLMSIRLTFFLHYDNHDESLDSARPITD
jgi:hypothetical protein